MTALECQRQEERRRGVSERSVPIDQEREWQRDKEASEEQEAASKVAYEAKRHDQRCVV